MTIIPNLPKISRDKPVKERDHLKDATELRNGIQAMSENMATADITAVYMADRIAKGEPLDMGSMRTVAHQLEEIYEILMDLFEITDVYCPDEEE